MLQPKKTKYRKQHRLRGQGKNVATKGATIAFGEIAIKAIQAGEITSRQIEATRRVVSRRMRQGGKLWIRIFPDKNLTAKSGEVPMGSGKGAPHQWVAQIRKGTIIFEMAGLEDTAMREALKAATYKLPVTCKIISNEI